jgi:hypothetical protein
MSFIVCRGLGGSLSIPNGYGATTEQEIERAVLIFETGNLRIECQKFNDGVMVIFDDGDNYINRWFALTANQLAGDDWFVVNLARDGSTLYIAIDKSERQSADLVSPLKEYGGKVTVMRGKAGGIFDLRGVPKKTGTEHVDYYIDDLTENAGKAMLP